MPLGFLGLAVATLLTSCLELGFIPTNEQHEVGLAILLFTVPLQLIATVFGLLARDAVVASGIGVQGGGWFAISALLLFGPTGAKSYTLAILLFGAAASLLPAIAVAATAKLVPSLVMVGTACKFTLVGLSRVVGYAHPWRQASGFEGIALAALAIYTALALDVESSRHRTVLPTGRVGPGRQALSESAREEVSTVYHEPGVREEL